MSAFAHYFTSTNLAVGTAVFFLVWLVLLLVVRRREKRVSVMFADTAAVVESLRDGLIVVDSSDVILHINPAAEKILKVKRKQVEGRQADKAELEKAGLGQVAKVMFYGEAPADAEASSQNRRNEIVLDEPVGRIVQVISTPVRDVDDRLHGFMHVLHDVTDERTLEHMKTSLVFILSHSLRTPLGGVKWAVDMLLKGEVKGEEQKPVFEQIKKQNDLMQGMVESLITSSEIQKGTLAYSFAETDLSKVVQGAVALTEEAAKQKKVKLTVEAPKSTVKISGDAGKLTLAIQNLVQNAVKYTNAEGTVTVTLTEKHSGAEIVVKDSGVGIPKEQQAHIFSQFFWAKNVIMHQHEGAGLGLFITKQIVDAHKGKIEVESAEGKGSTFTVHLPKKS